MKMPKNSITVDVFKNPHLTCYECDRAINPLKSNYYGVKVKGTQIEPNNFFLCEKCNSDLQEVISGED